MLEMEHGLRAKVEVRGEGWHFISYVLKPGGPLFRPAALSFRNDRLVDPFY
jgi:hypothetical protein